MAGEGKNKVASSLLDLQPTAVLELFKIFPDRINKPTLFLGFHGGTLYDKSLIWQGVQYLPLSIETDGFDILADGQLARPKIKVSNKGNIVTNFLQNYKDFINAKVVRKRVSVKFLDDANFDGGNPFGVADAKAELTNQEWIVGRKLAESKLFAEFELNSPLDLESFNVNSRGIVSKFCYWQYRGEGCRYEGQPIEREDGLNFKDVDGNQIVPRYRPPLNPDATGPASDVNFFYDATAEWSASNTYVTGDTVYVKSPSISIQGKPLKTVYVCVSGNSSQIPEGNPSFWQKDGCTKRFSACQKRFNEDPNLSFIVDAGIESGFNTIKITGSRQQQSPNKPFMDPTAAAITDQEIFNQPFPDNSGIFHSTRSELTGIMTGEFCIVGWAHTGPNGPFDGGVFSTSSRDDGNIPLTRFINIGQANHNRAITNPAFRRVKASFLSDVNPFSPQHIELNHVQRGAGWWRNPREYHQYVITHETGVQQLKEAVDGGNEIGSALRSIDTSLSIRVDGEVVFPQDLRNGNFANIQAREQFIDSQGNPAPLFPQTFMLGGIVKRYGSEGFENNGESFISSMNGRLGPWAIWNRKLTETELEFLYKPVVAPEGIEPQIPFVPRPYYECTDNYAGITGDRLVAWWDGTTGFIGDPADDVTGMLDIHTVGPYHLTGSGSFKGSAETYKEAAITKIANETPPFPRFGGFPGTDGFSYERNSSIY
tara:strand:- start:2235 stop:4364 length:2130 start_codon:yes stop_codon:yes gene_type:complete